MSNVSRWLRVALTISVIAALVLFARSIDWGATAAAMRGVDPAPYLAAALIHLASAAIKSIRWWVFLRPIGVPSIGLALRATFAGAALNNLFVAHAGEAGRVAMVARATRAPAAGVAATVALERLFEFLGFLTLLVIVLAAAELPAEVARYRPFGWLGLAILLVFLGYLMLTRREVPDAAGRRTRRGWMERLREQLGCFAQTLGAVSTGRRFVVATAVTAAAWLLQVTTYHLTAVAAGMPIPLAGTAAAVAAVNLGIGVRTTPGGVGVFQLLYGTVAAAFGMNLEQAIAVGLLIQIQQNVPVTLLGLALAPDLVRSRGRVGTTDHESSPAAAG